MLPSTPPRTSTSRKGGLPAPTPSEAAFERLLAGFDADGASAGPSDPATQRPSDRAEAAKSATSPRLPFHVVTPETADTVSETDDVVLANDDGTSDAFLTDLFARRESFLVRDRFASIGEASEFHTKIVGVTFEGRQDVVAGLSTGDAVRLVREPENAYDAQAIAVRYGDLALGYLRRDIAKHLAAPIDAGERYVAVVASVTGGGERSTGINLFIRRERRRVASARARHAGAATSHDDVRRALIGDRPLRDAQREVLARVGDGRNTLAVLGTGRGKSLCFQLPAAENALATGAKTLVFYPLRALANDQFAALERRLAPLGVRILRANGSIDGEERAALDEALATGAWDVVLATPEFAAFHRDAFLRPENRPSFVVVDEAHHVFESRHRPAYGELGAFVRALGAPCVLALTATADDDAFDAIRRALAIDAWVIDPTVRENLHLVDARDTADKNAYLARELEGDGKAIVYGNSRAEVTKLAERLRARFGSGVAFYHAGVPTAERGRVEDLFRSGDVRVVVATSAFGEGIDLPDVRDVVLYHLNFDFTDFNQMAGRAGRDGGPARVHLLYGERDRRINDYIIARSAPSLEVLRELYRGMRGLAQADVVRMTFEDVARTLDLDMADGSTVGTAVRIFAEAGLVATGIDDDGRYVRFEATSAKVDLTTTARYAEGLAERESFERFCKLALGADAPTLEQIVNRPIYPDRVPLLA